MPPNRYREVLAVASGARDVITGAHNAEVSLYLKDNEQRDTDRVARDCEMVLPNSGDNANDCRTVSGSTGVDGKI